MQIGVERTQGDEERGRLRRRMRGAGEGLQRHRCEHRADGGHEPRAAHDVGHVHRGLVHRTREPHGGDTDRGTDGVPGHHVPRPRHDVRRRLGLDRERGAEARKEPGHAGRPGGRADHREHRG